MAMEWNSLRKRNGGFQRRYASSSHVSSIVKANHRLPQFVRLFALRILKEVSIGGELANSDPYLLFNVPYDIIVKFADVYIDDLNTADDFIEWFRFAMLDADLIDALDRKDVKLSRMAKLPYWAYWAILSRRQLLDEIILGRKAFRSDTFSALCALNSDALEVLINDAASIRRASESLIFDFAEITQKFPNVVETLQLLSTNKQIYFVENPQIAWRWLSSGGRVSDLRYESTSSRSNRHATHESSHAPNSRTSRMVLKRKRVLRSQSPVKPGRRSVDTTSPRGASRKTQDEAFGEEDCEKHSRKSLDVDFDDADDTHTCCERHDTPNVEVRRSGQQFDDIWFFSTCHKNTGMGTVPNSEVIVKQLTQIPQAVDSSANN
eukprot:GHVH01006957.1.p1 GENE.GHVH01006957.1~~GHVH01006957.1.p1  ORF type:complete len:378 (+),score=44.72 GHVH01006957.1:1380-2513(+)